METRVDGVSWWQEAQAGPRERFYAALTQEQPRIQRLGLSPTAADIALHRRTRKQLEKAKQERED